MNGPTKRMVAKFVEFIPKELEYGKIYFSGEYATTAHLCACGCGERVILPLHPTDWRLQFDGKTITIRPSVGNWSFQCKSHYLITGSRIQWADQWNDDQITRGRSRDALRKRRWQDQHPIAPAPSVRTQVESAKKPNWYQRLFKRILSQTPFQKP